MRTGVVFAALLAVTVAGCAQTRPVAELKPAPTRDVAAVLAPDPAPSVSVLATVIHKPAAKPVAKPKPHITPRPKPRSTHKPKAKPRPGVLVCTVNQPCDLSKATWHRTVGCTVAWRKALHRTTCPPGWPPIP